MKNLMDAEIIDSVGIEIEFSCFDRQNHAILKTTQKQLPQYKLVHDASCETPATYLHGTSLPIELQGENDEKLLSPLLRHTIIGGEIISPIRHSNSPEWVKEVYKLCDLLWEFGETEESKRDSLHIHVNVSQSIPLYALKNLLKLTASLEAIMFRLAGMGRENRGEENNYCFCRPYLGNGPPVLRMKIANKAGDGYEMINVPIVNFDDLMNSETKRDFFDRFGDSINHAEHRRRYVTQRYMVVNFYPVLTQGSFEFRPANKTLNPEYIIAWTNFCKAFVEKAFTTKDTESLENIQRPLYENRDISYEEFLHALSYLPINDEDTMYVLSEIWTKSPTPKFDNVWRFTHLRDPTYYRRGARYIPEPLRKNIKIEDAVFLDIHHFEHVPRREREGRGIRLERNAIRNVGINNEPPMPDVNVVRVNQNDYRALAFEVPMDQISPDFEGIYGEDGIDITFIRIAADRVRLIIFDNDNEAQQEYLVSDNYANFLDLPWIIRQYLNGIALERITPNRVVAEREEM